MMVGQNCPHRILWAKSEPQHYLWCHLIDVGATLATLWDGGFLSDGWKCRFAQNLAMTETQARNLALWLAAMHDLGKACPQFQCLENGPLWAAVQKAFSAPKPGNEKLPHGDASGQIIKAHLTTSGWSKPLADTAAKAAGGHHGYPFGSTEEAWHWICTALHPDTPWREAHRQLIAEVAAALCLASPPQPTAGAGEVSAAFLDLAGLISFADWIGSASQYFAEKIAPNDPHADAQEYAGRALEQASKALHDFGWRRLASPAARRDYGDLFLSPDKRTAGAAFVPNPLQGEVARLIDAQPDTRLLLVEAPMGEGKTEAALYAARHWLERFQQRGVYLALPSQATSNAMYSRFEAWIEHLRLGTDVGVLLLHGGPIKPEAFANIVAKSRAQLFDNKKVPGRSDKTADPSANDATEATAHEWFLQSKRGLLAPFGVGTIDQILLGVLRCRHHFVRLHGLAGKTVIFDEVHAYDAYTGRLLDRLLEYLGMLGSTVILLSATLPGKRRLELFQAFAGRPLEEHAANSGYPRVIAASKVATTVASGFETSPTSKKSLRLAWLPNDLESAVRTFSEQIGPRGCGAFVFNTVDEAQQAYQAAKSLCQSDPAHHFDRIMLLHSRFTAGERQERESELLKLFGKNDEGEDHRPKGRALVIATQVIEQSLDLDFDVMATELAPIDLLLQRTGRLHRHQRSHRPTHLAQPMLLVRQPSGTETTPDYGKSEWVYRAAILMRTHALLMAAENAGMTIPEDVERLIEKAYGPHSDAEFPELWRAKHREEMGKLDEDVKKKHIAAASRMLPAAQKAADYWSRPGAYHMNDEDDAAVHSDLNPVTRDGEQTIRAICLHEVHGRLCFDVDGSEAANEGKAPSPDTLKRLLRNMAAFPVRAFGFGHERPDPMVEAPPPEAWRRYGVLRYLPVFRYRDGRCRLPGGRLSVWDEETGFREETQKKG